MANGKYETVEVRFLIEPELTQCYVRINADHNCPHMVQGWHHKTFPASKPVVDIVTNELYDAVMWPLNAPPA